MGCCDKKRAFMRQAAVTRPDKPLTRRLKPGGRAAEVRLRYLGNRAVRVRGSASGRVYVVPGRMAGPVLVDSRDVAALVRTGYFSH